MIRRWYKNGVLVRTLTVDVPPVKAQNVPGIIRSLHPGSAFALAIKKITGAIPCARCNQRIRVMNDWGWFKCWQNRRIIASWLAEEAHRRGHQITSDSAVGLLKAVIREIRRSSL